ncbi:MAG: hypothetical protein KDA74_08715 [Planctomycetaceae bacterium]|nr:hypothetical protein [Planctomycetaceae bacterium]
MYPISDADSNKCLPLCPIYYSESGSMSTGVAVPDSDAVQKPLRIRSQAIPVVGPAGILRILKTGLT